MNARQCVSCTASDARCTVGFDDPTFTPGAADVAYHGRAIREPNAVVNGGGLRCERDEAGCCIRVRPCWPDPRSDPGGDCLAEIEERAWSSPILVSAARSFGH